MPPINNRLYYDVWDGAGNLLLPDQGHVFDAGTLGTTYAAKLHGDDNHALVTTDGTDIYAKLMGFTPGSSPDQIVSTLLFAASANGVRGMARDDRTFRPGRKSYNSFYFCLSEELQDLLIRLIYEGNTAYWDALGVVNTTSIPIRGIAFDGQQFMLGLTNGSPYGVVTAVLDAAGILQPDVDIAARLTVPPAGCVWNGQSLAFLVSNTSTPPTSYSVFLYSAPTPTPGTSGHVLTLCTRSGTFPGEGLGRVVDIDWDGRNYYVWYVCGVDVGA